MIFCEGSTLTVADFRSTDVLHETQIRHASSDDGETLKETLERVELEAIAEAMARNKGNKKKVAEELGISRSYLYKRLEELNS